MIVYLFKTDIPYHYNKMGMNEHGLRTNSTTRSLMSNRYSHHYVKTRLGYTKIDEWRDWLAHVLKQDIANLSFQYVNLYITYRTLWSVQCSAIGPVYEQLLI